MPPARRSFHVLQEATEPPSPAAVTPLEAYRRRNAALDSLFYDVRRVSNAEAQILSPWLVAEGAVLRVPPSGGGRLRAYASVERFVAEGGDACRALSVAGVGSSALGAAAFARNVADALGGDVVAVVSGYGMADAMMEGLGGWFWFGGINRWRRAQTLGMFGPLLSSTAIPDPATALGRLFSRDLRTVIDLLNHPRLGFELVIGHSKGNLVLSEALYERVRRAGDAGRAIHSETLVVTMSAAITMPPVFETVVDVMGELDWFGRLNSDAAIAIDVAVPGAWHHTNTELENHLPVTELLRGILGNEAGRRRFSGEQDHQAGGEAMPAKSKAQQKAAGAALSAKRGDTKVSELKGASKEMYDSMSESQLEEFAETKRKGLPKKKGD